MYQKFLSLRLNKWSQMWIITSFRTVEATFIDSDPLVPSPFEQHSLHSTEGSSSLQLHSLQTSTMIAVTSLQQLLSLHSDNFSNLRLQSPPSKQCFSLFKNELHCPFPQHIRLESQNVLSTNPSSSCEKYGPKNIHVKPNMDLLLPYRKKEIRFCESNRENIKE